MNAMFLDNWAEQVHDEIGRLDGVSPMFADIAEELAVKSLRDKLGPKRLTTATGKVANLPRPGVAA